MDGEGLDRVSFVSRNFASLSGTSRQELFPRHFENRNLLSPSLDIVFADFGYNTEQFAHISGLSYMSRGC